MPPWLVATRKASTQNCQALCMKKPNTQVNIYTQMPKPTMARAPNRLLSRMYSRQKGRPSICTISRASIMAVESSPSISP